MIWKTHILNLIGLKELIIKTFLNEETKFKQTIDNGLKILEDEIDNTSNNIFDGKGGF